MRRLFTLLLVVIPMLAMAQKFNNGVNPEDMDVDMDNPTFVPMVKIGKVKQGRDSIQYVELNNIWVYPQPEFKNARQRAAYNRLIYNIKRVLPIAKECDRIIIETGEYLELLPNKKAKDQHMKVVEQDIKREYTPRVKKLTYSQGKLLIPIRAGFYQSFAWIFGASLKKSYDPNGADRITERIVRQVEAGQL